MALVAEQSEAPIFADVAARLKARQADELEATNEVILTHLHSPIALIPEVARHLIMAGGKRLRPLLTLSAAELCGLTGEGPRCLAGAVELIHAATLLHDDVVDNSALRRGFETANVVFGNKESVLVGDFLFARAFELMVKTDSLPVLEVLSAASSTIAEGEVLQLTTETALETSEAIYIDVIKAKTAALFAAATHAGALLANAAPDVTEGLRQFGEEFGIAYQMVDDTLDYDALPGDIGKAAGDDFREGKMTLPVILASRAARDDRERAFWARTIGEKDQRDGDFEEALRLIRRDDVVEQCLDQARTHADLALNGLDTLPVSPLRDLLADLARASVARRV